MTITVFGNMTNVQSKYYNNFLNMCFKTISNIAVKISSEP